MRRLILALVLAFAFTSVAQAVPIVWDFESLALGNYSSLTKSFGSFTMSLYRSSGGELVVNNTTPLPASWGNQMMHYQSPATAGEVFVLNFSSAITNFSIDFGDFGNDDDTPVSAFGYSGADGTGALLAGSSDSYTGADALPSFKTLAFSGAPMSSVTFTSGGPAPNSLAWDNITVEPVPEPGTMALFGFGLAAGAARLRRKFGKKS